MTRENSNFPDQGNADGLPQAQLVTDKSHPDWWAAKWRSMDGSANIETFFRNRLPFNAEIAAEGCLQAMQEADPMNDAGNRLRHMVVMNTIKRAQGDPQ